MYNCVVEHGAEGVVAKREKCGFFFCQVRYGVLDAPDSLLLLMFPIKYVRNELFFHHHKNTMKNIKIQIRRSDFHSVINNVYEI